MNMAVGAPPGWPFGANIAAGANMAVEGSVPGAPAAIAGLKPKYVGPAMAAIL